MRAPATRACSTWKGRDVLARAQVVVHDRLVSQAILDLIPPEARRIDVGKNAGHHPVPQGEINQILVREALAGHRVVRLKGGDSFLFGRGGEELEQLARLDIPFEVVPGITSALAAPAYAGIPVTHRDYCSSLHIITGHKKADGQLELDYGALVRLQGTLVFLMSVGSLGQIAQGLLAAGMSPDMPCALVENGTLPQQRSFSATLDTVAQVARDQEVRSPAVFLVGRVASLARQFHWFDRLPLKGKRLLVHPPAGRELCPGPAAAGVGRPSGPAAGHPAGRAGFPAAAFGFFRRGGPDQRHRGPQLLLRRPAGPRVGRPGFGRQTPGRRGEPNSGGPIPLSACGRISSPRNTTAPPWPGQ